MTNKAGILGRLGSPRHPLQAPETTEYFRRPCSGKNSEKREVFSESKGFLHLFAPLLCVFSLQTPILPVDKINNLFLLFMCKFNNMKKMECTFFINQKFTFCSNLPYFSFSVTFRQKNIKKAVDIYQKYDIMIVIKEENFQRHPPNRGIWRD